MNARIAAGFVACALAGSALGQSWSENFDSYANGSPLSGQGGWAPWCSGGIDGQVSNQQAASAPNSFRVSPTTDMVQTFAGRTSGQWVFRIKTYIPASATGNCSIIVLNRYCATVNNDWSIVAELNADTGLAGIYLNGVVNAVTLPLVRDQWVEYRAEIDLGADTLREFYNGQEFGSAHTWTSNVLAGGQLEIAALDLYSTSTDGAFYDDASLTPVASCYPDCNGDGQLNLSDFGCFTTQFALAMAYADCNGDGIRNLADFGCFTTKFALGCP